MENVSRFAPHSIAVGIICVACGSQVLYYYIEPGPLAREESLKLNSLVGATWICFARSCFLNAGSVPKGWQPKDSKADGAAASDTFRRRWCRKCDAPKPPRAHHCKTCKRCIPKMDHHCPWTANCVSNRTFPHFVRLLLFATISMIYIEYLLCIRAQIIWNKRHLPSYLGPSPLQLALLFIILVTNSFILFVVGILTLRTLSSLALNTTTIESWEIERHQVLLRRAKAFGGYLDGPDGTKLRIVRQEFPYDIGIWSNITQGMGGNLLTWFFPLSPSPGLHDGLEFPVNDFEEPSKQWPPPDPDRMLRRPVSDTAGFVDAGADDATRISAFRARQAADALRKQSMQQAQRRRPFHQRFDESGSQKSGLPAPGPDGEGEESWRSSEGERLQDFGLDEEAEFYDEDEWRASAPSRKRV